MAKKRLHIGLIGCGINMRFAHVSRIFEDGAVSIAAVADPVRAAADALMVDAGAKVPYFEDWRELLREVELDGVIISTPHDVHYPQVRTALRTGIPVLVEKPLTISAKHSRALLKLSEEKGVPFLVAYQRHSMAPYRYARELIARGAIGSVDGVVGYVTQTPAARIEWRLDRAASGGGMFADTGSHLVAASLWLTELLPRRVRAFVDTAGTPVDVNTTVQVNYEGGPMGTLSTFGNAGRHDERLSIVGTEGSIVLHLHEWKFRSLLVNDVAPSIPKRIADSTPDDDFFALLRRGGSGHQPPVHAHRAVQFTEAVYRSAASGAAATIRS